jgi:hypothetical protein
MPSMDPGFQRSSHSGNAHRIQQNNEVAGATPVVALP